MISKTKFKTFGISLLLSSLCLTARPASAADGPEYWSCSYGAGTSPIYYSDVFSSPKRDIEKLWEKRDRFMEAIITEFGKHPQMVKAGKNHRPQCDKRKSREDAETLLEMLMKSMSGRNAVIYDTKWTPQEGIQNTKPLYVPKK